MSAVAALVAGLRAKGVRLTPEDDNLRVRGPAIAMTAEVYQQVTLLKAEILTFLWAQPVVVPEGNAESVPSALEATFLQGVRVQIRRESAGRWAAWLMGGGRWIRQNGLTSPSAEHLQRCMEERYGEPIEPWNPTGKPER